MTERLIFTSATIAYGHYGRSHYRIEVDLSNKFEPLQRHIWTKDNGSFDVETWIRGVKGETPEDMIKRGWTRVTNPLPAYEGA